MEYKLNVVRDSHNSYPDTSLEIVDHEGADIVTLKITDAERCIEVNKKDLMRVLAAMGIYK